MLTRGLCRTSEIPASARAPALTSFAGASASSRGRVGAILCSVRAKSSHRCSQRIAHEDDIKPVGLRTTRRHRIVRALEANGLVAKRRQHLLLPQKPFPGALDDHHRLAVSKREQWRRGGSAVRRRCGQPELNGASAIVMQPKPGILNRGCAKCLIHPLGTTMSSPSLPSSTSRS